MEYKIMDYGATAHNRTVYAAPAVAGLSYTAGTLYAIPLNLLEIYGIKNLLEKMVDNMN